MTSPGETNTDATRYLRSPDFVLRQEAAQQLLIPVRSPMPHGVLVFLLDGPVALLLWEALATSRTFAELEALVLAEFEVSPAQARGELKTYLRQLERLGALAPVLDP